MSIGVFLGISWDATKLAVPSWLPRSSQLGLKEWLHKSIRGSIEGWSPNILNALELAQAIPHPAGIKLFMMLGPKFLKIRTLKTAVEHCICSLKSTSWSILQFFQWTEQADRPCVCLASATAKRHITETSSIKISHPYATSIQAPTLSYFKCASNGWWLVCVKDSAMGFKGAPKRFASTFALLKIEVEAWAMSSEANLINHLHRMVICWTRGGYCSCPISLGP